MKYTAPGRADRREVLKTLTKSGERLATTVLTIRVARKRGTAGRLLFMIR